MIRKFEFLESAKRQFKRLDRPVQDRIVAFIEERVLPTEDPHTLGKALTGELGGLWSYRIGDYRLICRFENKDTLVVGVRVGHRREVYD